MSRNVIVSLAVLAAVLAVSNALPRGFFEHTARPAPNAGSSSQPLILTDFLQTPDAARKLSEVIGIGNYPSFSGYFTVNATYGSNMFFWYFPAQNKDPNAPLIMFLQGGPGASSMFGLFSEMGPYTVSADGKKVVPNPHTWNAKYSMVFVDNPVGAGWSFTQDERGFVRNEVDVARNLYNLLEQFFIVFSETKSVPFYIAGESYAGHYVPAIAHEVMVRNEKTPKVYINLVGIAIGDGSIDPQIQFRSMGDLWFRMGLISMHQKEQVRVYEHNFEQAVKAKEFVKAFHIFDQLLNGDFYSYGTLFANMTGLNNYFNYLEPEYPPNPYPNFLNLASTREAIHVGACAYWDYNATVEQHLIPDWMTSVAPLLTPLMDRYKVLIYTGQLDIILGTAANEEFLHSLPWSGHAAYRTAPQKIWYPNDDSTKAPYGYATSVNRFRHVTVRNAGHLLPLDQPVAALDMITRFIENHPFHP